MRGRIAVVTGLAVLLASAVAAQTPKPGGTLAITQREDLPQGFAIHETSTISTVWPAMPCFNNLVLFDPLKKTESVDTIIGELAEKWSWQDNYRNLVFFLRKGVRWHDGQPFTSRDVKVTFDLLREAAGDAVLPSDRLTDPPAEERAHERRHEEIRDGAVVAMPRVDRKSVV